MRPSTRLLNLLICAAAFALTSACAGGGDGQGYYVQSESELSPIESAESETSVMFTLDRLIFDSYGVDTREASYKVTYLGFEESEKLVFGEDWKALIEIRDLPAGEVGDFILQIYSEGILVMQGQASDVALSSGLNQLALTLRSVSPDPEG